MSKNTSSKPRNATQGQPMGSGKNARGNPPVGVSGQAPGKVSHKPRFGSPGQPMSGGGGGGGKKKGLGY